MTYVPNGGYRVTHYIAADVANAGTFTVAYPSGTTQLDFNAGLYKEGSGHSIVANQNKWSDTSSSGIAFTTFGASDITLTNNTGATLSAGTKVEVYIPTWVSAPVFITVPISLASVAIGDVVTEIRPGVAGYITHMEFVTGVAVTTAAKAATLNAEIDTTNVTGGTVALTSAALTPKGARVASARITAANRLEKTSKLSIEASAVTAFVEGDGWLLIKIQPDVL